MTIKDTTHSLSSTIDGELVIVPEQPAVGSIVRSLDDVLEGDDCVVYADHLDFALVNAVLRKATVSAVVVATNDFADHARKMLQEAGIALFVHDASTAFDTELDRCLIDSQGMTKLGKGAPISAICSVLNDRNLKEYRRFGIDKLGYFRFKFCLFQLFSEFPEAHQDPTQVEEYLLQRLGELGRQHWTSIRCVLSDPTSAELAEMGITVATEVNPDLGLRGPRTMNRWVPELRAIRRFMESSEVPIHICAPFISSADEYSQFLSLIDDIGIDLERVKVGFTLEVPAVADSLESLFSSHRVDFMGVGTSDLFALYNGVDRNNPWLSVDANSPANVGLLRRIVATASEFDVDLFVCGEIRRNDDLMTALLNEGVSELICSARRDELVKVTRLSGSCKQ